MKYIKKFEAKEFKVGDYVRFNQNCSGDEESRRIIFEIISIDKNNHALLKYPTGTWKTVDLNYLKNCIDVVPEYELNVNKYNL